jgi:uncharacterized OB-fold protein
MPTRRPPAPDEVSRFHWDAAAAGRLEVQRCGECGRHQYPPTIGCVACGSGDLPAAEVSGRGTVYSFTVSHRAYEPGFVDDVPYVVALVTLEEDEHTRMLTNIVGAEPADIEIGMPVEVTFEPLGDFALPQFRPC